MAASAKSIRLNKDTGFLKLVAITAMLIDHVGAVFLPQYPILRIIGRIAFPIFAYCLAVGCIFTHDMRKYVLRVAILAVVSQPIYVTAMNHQVMGAFDWSANFYRVDLIFQHYWNHPGIMLSLLLGLLLLWTIRDKKYVLTAVMVAVCWYLQGKLDYGLKGIILMVLFYCFCDRPLASLAWVGGFMLWWGVPSISSAFSLAWIPTWRVQTQFYALLALPFIYFPTNTGIKVNKYVFYAFYPTHLLLIYIIRMLNLG